MRDCVCAFVWCLRSGTSTHTHTHAPLTPTRFQFPTALKQHTSDTGVRMTYCVFYQRLLVRFLKPRSGSERCLSIGGQPCSAVSHPLCDIGQSYNFFLPARGRKRRGREKEIERGGTDSAISCLFYPWEKLNESWNCRGLIDDNSLFSFFLFFLLQAKTNVSTHSEKCKWQYTGGTRLCIIRRLVLSLYIHTPLLLLSELTLSVLFLHPAQWQAAYSLSLPWLCVRRCARWWL